ncbi:hypothetical protein [Bergeriella denitrificans]|uniref:Uncharacterized protein n=1 Tax=Bergeriella denitrificans TaxID=494 RepID=A0A378UIK6_BERDE|nr:hypothetical protein [Bergeriella denitrificans]STZ76312.1 Uncharacterised protein [Bergeriella denitrificans]
MITRCPNCGAGHSLEVLVAHEEAREALAAVSGISDGLTRAAIRYLGLFRPSENALSFKRVAKLLNELQPLIAAGEIERNRKTYPAPRDAWIWAFEKTVEAARSGSIKELPLKSHGWLLQTLTYWQPPCTTVQAERPPRAKEAEQSKLRDGVGGLMAWANGGIDDG